MNTNQAKSSPPPPSRPMIDAHLDLAWNAVSFNRDLMLEVDELRRLEHEMTDEPCRGRATVTLPEMRRANVSICVATLLARSGPEQQAKQSLRRSDADHASPMIAHASVHAQLAYYRVLEDAGEVVIIQTSDDLRNLWDRQANLVEEMIPLGIILSMEGADPMICPDSAESWQSNGLRIVGLAHYGQGRYAAGTESTGGLTKQGIELLNRLDSLGMILDVTHLTDEGLDQSLDLYKGPMIASHHNCRALVPGERQLADRHIRALTERGGVIGVALDAWMLHKGWERGVTSPSVLQLASLADHIDHICQIVGNVSQVGIGSDLDGGFGTEQTPHDLDTICDLQKLSTILDKRGYTSDEIDAIFYGNWLGFFLSQLPENT